MSVIEPEEMKHLLQLSRDSYALICLKYIIQNPNSTLDELCNGTSLTKPAAVDKLPYLENADILTSDVVVLDKGSKVVGNRRFKIAEKYEPYKQIFLDLCL